jgi:ABC-type cobalt transport system substrate-binding protein
MNTRFLFLAMAAVIACIIFYFVGYRHGIKKSPARSANVSQRFG